MVSNVEPVLKDSTWKGGEESPASSGSLLWFRVAQEMGMGGNKSRERKAERTVTSAHMCWPLPVVNFPGHPPFMHLSGLRSTLIWFESLAALKVWL